MMKPELIKAFTPMFIATIGGVIGISVIFSPNVEEAQQAAAIGLAGTAIAGAAGLAQSSATNEERPKN
ncbi:MAG: hypothetical protein AAFW84_03615 [Cyanobacteria bacterium J06635_15]